MDRFFFCPVCCSDHNAPADPQLGHRVLCWECALNNELAADPAGPVAYDLVSDFDSAVAA